MMVSIATLGPLGRLRAPGTWGSAAGLLWTAFIPKLPPAAVADTARLGLGGLGVLTQIGPLRSLWDSLGQHFKDPRMRQLFARYATYCGSSPWQAPATLMLIAQVELDGVWSVQGGMVAMAQALARVARRHGAVFRYHSSCHRIEKRQGRVCGVRLQSGEFLPADRVIFNGDAQALRQGLLGDDARQSIPKASTPRSLSALTKPCSCCTMAKQAMTADCFWSSGYLATSRSKRA